MDIFKSVEKKLLESVQSKLVIEQVLDEKTLTFSNKTYFDGILIHEYDFDMNVIANVLEKRILKKLKNV